MVTVRDVRTFITAPGRWDLVVVKIETSEPGLYGLGCATFTQRALAVKTAVDEYLRPMMIGRDVAKIEDAWQQMMGSSYWRNGPVLNNAISGIDEALWDIKGKMAGMPVYDLLGGKCREGVRVMPYVNCSGASLQEVGDKLQALLARGLDYVRIGYHSRPVSDSYGSTVPAELKPQGAPEGYYLDPRRNMADAVAVFKYLRERFGEEPALMMDVHERYSPTDAVRLCRALEPYHPYFLEDCLAPENAEWFTNIREACSIPMAMGELFNNPMEYKDLIIERKIDFMRAHISQLGGFTPARKLAAFCEAFGVKTIWHGPDDLSPVGMAAQIHLDLNTPNCDLQEYGEYSDTVREMFPGAPYMRGGYCYVSDAPGWGVDFKEEMAPLFPPKGYHNNGFMARIPDGTPVRS